MRTLTAGSGANHMQATMHPSGWSCRTEQPRGKAQSLSRARQGREPGLLRRARSTEAPSGPRRFMLVRGRVLLPATDVHEGKTDLHDYEGKCRLSQTPNDPQQVARQE